MSGDEHGVRQRMPGMTLERIAQACGGVYVGPAERAQAVIAGAVTDSRQVEEDYLFIALKGQRVDGHDFIPEVYGRGALAVVSERELDQPQPYIRVASALDAMKKLAAFYRQELQVKVVGITGSVGKTSTKEMLASILEQRYRVLKTENNHNNEIGVPLTIFRIREEHEVAVLEMGISDFGEMHRLAEMTRPDICVITNIGWCHLENLGTRDGVLAAKTESFAHLQPEGIAVLNGDDDKLCTKTVVNGRPALFYGMGEKDGQSEAGVRMAEKAVYATDVENLDLEGMRAVIHTPEGEFTANIPLPGEHHVYNALAGTAVGLALNLTLEEIAKGIAAVKAIEGRSHVIEKDGITIIDDCYNANPVSMRASLGVLAHRRGRRIAVLGDMGELGAEGRSLHRSVGAVVAESGIDVLFAAGESAREYADAARGSGCEVHYYENVDNMLRELPACVKNGDTVLVKASHFMNFSRVVKLLCGEIL